jgi:hypothetical protein
MARFFPRVSARFHNRQAISAPPAPPPAIASLG